MSAQLFSLTTVWKDFFWNIKTFPLFVWQKWSPLLQELFPRQQLSKHGLYREKQDFLYFFTNAREFFYFFGYTVNPVIFAALYFHEFGIHNYFPNWNFRDWWHFCTRILFIPSLRENLEFASDIFRELTQKLRSRENRIYSIY